VAATIIFCNSIASMTDYMLSGVLARYPKMKMMYAECQIGWIPYLLERIDDVWDTHRGWSNSQVLCPEPPSTYYHQSIYSCFFKDNVGVQLIDKIGHDKVMFETDYPHQDGTFPHSRRAAAEQFGHLDQNLIRKIARGNAISLFGLDLAP
jgi:predicted TIM-barrel fold metal-dependent hydrolase